MQSPAFYFSEQEMKELLSAFYFGRSKRWASRLERLDNAAWIQKAKAVVTDPEKVTYGNSLLGEFSHQQLASAISDLKARPAEETIGHKGFWEYCLRVWIGKANPAAKHNLGKPPVEPSDILEALTEFTHCLQAVRQRLDTGANRQVRARQLKSLFGQLAEITPQKELCHV